MFRTRIFLFLIALLPIISCGDSQTTSGDSTAGQAANNDDLIARLGKELIASPSDQRQKDQNALVNYAIDKNLDVTRHPSGIYYVITQEGAGTSPTKANRVATHYRGTLINGTEFDSSFKRNKPISFSLSQVVPGWQIGIPLLKPGGKGLFLIPSHLAYGQRGFPPAIGPNEPLIFEVELISVDS